MLTYASFPLLVRGEYDVTPDHQPILGPCRRPRTFVAAGFSGHGFMIAPAVARIVADCVLGRDRDEALDVLDAARFAERPASPSRSSSDRPIASQQVRRWLDLLARRGRVPATESALDLRDRVCLCGVAPGCGRGNRTGELEHDAPVRLQLVRRLLLEQLHRRAQRGERARLDLFRPVVTPKPTPCPSATCFTTALEELARAVCDMLGERAGLLERVEEAAIADRHSSPAPRAPLRRVSMSFSLTSLTRALPFPPGLADDVQRVLAEGHAAAGPRRPPFAASARSRRERLERSSVDQLRGTDGDAAGVRAAAAGAPGGPRSCVAHRAPHSGPMSTTSSPSTSTASTPSSRR